MGMDETGPHCKAVFIALLAYRVDATVLRRRKRLKITERDSWLRSIAARPFHSLEGSRQTRRIHKVHFSGFIKHTTLTVTYKFRGSLSRASERRWALCRTTRLASSRL